MTEMAIGVCAGQVACGLGEHKSLIYKLFLYLSNLTCMVNDPCLGSVVMDNLCAKGVITLLAHGPINAFGMGLIVGEEELLAMVEGRARELVCAHMKVLGVDGTSTSLSAKQFRACHVPVNHNEVGDLMMAIIRGDLKDVVNGSLFKIGVPARTGMYSWLGTSQQGSPCLLFFLLSNPSNLGVHIALYQCIDNLVKRGSGILWINLEKLGRRQRHGWDRVSGGHGLTIGALDVRGSKVDGMEVGDNLWGNFVVLRRGNRNCRSVVDRFNLPVIYVKRGVLQIGFVIGKNRRRGKVVDSRDSYGWCGREVGQHDQDRFVEHFCPVTNHCTVHECLGVRGPNLVG